VPHRELTAHRGNLEAGAQSLEQTLVNPGDRVADPLPTVRAQPFRRAPDLVALTLLRRLLAERSRPR